MGPLAGRIPSKCAIRYLRQLAYPSTPSPPPPCPSREKLIRLRLSRRYHSTPRIKQKTIPAVDDSASAGTDALPESPIKSTPTITPMRVIKSNIPSPPPPEPIYFPRPSISRDSCNRENAWKEKFYSALTHENWDTALNTLRQAIRDHADTDWKLLLKMSNRLMINLNKSKQYGIARCFYSDLEWTRRPLLDSIITEFLTALRRRNPVKAPNTNVAIITIRRAMNNGTPLTSSTFGAALRVMTDEGRIDVGEWYRKQWQRVGPIGSTSLIPVIKGYTRTGNVRKIEELRKWMVQNSIRPGRKFLSTLLDSYFRLGRPGDAQKVLSDMAASKMAPKDSTYEALILGYTRISDWNSLTTVFKMMENKGMPLSISLFNGILQILAEKRSFGTCYRFYYLARSKGLKLNTMTYNLLIKSCIWAKHLKHASNLLRYLRRERLAPDAYTVDQLTRVGELEHIRFRSLRNFYARIKAYDPNLLSPRSRNTLLTRRLSFPSPLEATESHINRLCINRIAARTLMRFYLRQKQYDTALLVFRRLLSVSITPTIPLFCLALRAAFSLRHEAPEFPTAIQLISTARSINVPLPPSYIIAAKSAAIPNRHDSLLPPSPEYRLLTIVNRKIESLDFSTAVDTLTTLLTRNDLTPDTRLVTYTLLIKAHILNKDLAALTHTVEKVIEAKVKIDAHFLLTLKGTSIRAWAHPERKQLAQRVKLAGDQRREKIDSLMEDWAETITRKSKGKLRMPSRKSNVRVGAFSNALVAEDRWGVGDGEIGLGLVWDTVRVKAEQVKISRGKERDKN